MALEVTLQMEYLLGNPADGFRNKWKKHYRGGPAAEPWSVALRTERQCCVVKGRFK